MQTALPLIRRVSLRNYKSIESCDVELGSVSILVGPNGSGKSNFLDALQFIHDALINTLTTALHHRGGIEQVARRTQESILSELANSAIYPEKNNNISIRIDLTLPNDQEGFYAFSFGKSPTREEVTVLHEQCSFGGARFETKNGQVITAPEGMSFLPISRDRLYLVNASGLPSFRPLYDALLAINIYKLNLDKMRSPQTPQFGFGLAWDGSNIASVLLSIEKNFPHVFERIKIFLNSIVPQFSTIKIENWGPNLALLLQMTGQEINESISFPAQSVSDGTLRALATLVALFQPKKGDTLQLVGLEEPETALHPAATGALLDAILSASRETQVILTTHSPDLLEHPDLPDESLIGVEFQNGRTVIGAIDPINREAIREKLYNAGELLRAGQLSPESSDRKKLLSIFEDWGGQ